LNYCRRELQSRRIEWILVENGSIDGSDTLVRSLGQSLAKRGEHVRIRNYKWADYSEAVRQGVLLSEGHEIVWLGVDIPDIASISRGLKVLEEREISAVLLSKYEGADWRPFLRIAINRTYNFLTRVFDQLWLSDVEGYMMIKKTVKGLLEYIDFSEANTINLNLLFFCKKLHMRVGHAPIYIYETRHREFLGFVGRVAWTNLIAIILIHKRFKQYSIRQRWAKTVPGSRLS